MMKKFCLILILTLGLCNTVKYFPILAYNALVCNTAVSFKNSTKKAAYVGICIDLIMLSRLAK